MLAILITLVILTLSLCLLFYIIFKIIRVKGLDLGSKIHRLVITPGCVVLFFSILTIILFKTK
jgi:Mn2+/Fe2+ NRAMP family transporter